MQAHRAGELKCNIFRLIERNSGGLRRTLKFRHLQRGAIDG
jgi:hypothetical protein